MFSPRLYSRIALTEHKRENNAAKDVKPIYSARGPGKYKFQESNTVDHIHRRCFGEAGPGSGRFKYPLSGRGEAPRDELSQTSASYSGLGFPQRMKVRDAGLRDLSSHFIRLVSSTRGGIVCELTIAITESLSDAFAGTLVDLVASLA